MLEIQKELKRRGFDPGPIDGIRGRRTISAIKAFQRSRRLTVDGIVGPLTTKALFADSISSDLLREEAQMMPWFEEARRLIGTREVGGKASNPAILDWADDLDIHYPDDDIPWCGLFVAHCIGSQLPDEPLPDNPLGARNWSRFGKKTGAVRGSVLVFWRGSKKGWKGHVGFYASEDDTTYHVLGGNQSNSVSIARIAKDRLIGARWPLTAANRSDRLVADLSGKLSTNEA